MSNYTVEISNIPPQTEPKHLLGAINQQIGYYTFKNRVNIVNGKCVLVFNSQEGYDTILFCKIQLFDQHVTVKPLNNRKRGSNGKIRKIRKSHKSKEEQNLITLEENIKLSTIPNWWSRSKSAQESSLIDLDINGPLVKNIIKTFQSTLKSSCEVFSVQGVQNPHLWKMYHCARKALKSNLNEQYLYHGTSIDVIKRICAQGFLRDFGEVMAYGKGIYFSKYAEYSASPRYSKLDSNGYQYTLLCRVIVGESCIGNVDYKVPLCKPNTNIHYESMVDNLNNPSIFVISKDYHSYPEFIIKFKTSFNSESQYFISSNITYTNYTPNPTLYSISKSTNDTLNSTRNSIKGSTTTSTSNSILNSIPNSTSNYTKNSTPISISSSITNSTPNSTSNYTFNYTKNSIPISTSSPTTNFIPSSFSNYTKNSTSNSTSRFTSNYTSNYITDSDRNPTRSSTSKSISNCTVM